MFHTIKRKWRLALLAAVFVMFQTAGRANHDELDFFEPLATPSGHALPFHAIEHMSRRVRVVSALLERDAFNLNLFPGHTFRVQRDRIVDYGNGDFAWTGHIDEEPVSRVTFASRGGIISGVVDRALDNGNELYELAPTADGEYLLFQANEDKLPPRAPGVPPSPHKASEPLATMPDGEVTLAATDPASAALPIVQDIMVLYTPASASRYGQSGIESKILQAITDANAAYQNSQVNAQLNLVYLGEVSYVETGNMSTALTALQSTSDGKLDAIHSLRNQVGADLVCLIDEDSNYCGIAYVMQSVSTAFAPYAFSVVYSGCLSSLTLPHELGHNQGNQHDRANSSSQGAYPYSYGWRRCVTDGTGFRDIMSYSCSGGTRVPYFSNPNLSLYGYPLGVDYEADPANAADTVRSMNNTAATVASFRAAAASPWPAAPSGLSAIAIAYNKISLTWLDNANNESEYHIERSLDGSAWSEIATVAANATSFTNTGLSANMTYYYRLRAWNSAGYSSYSNSASAETPLASPKPVAPSNLAAVAVSSSQINLTWSDLSDNENGFKIQRSTDNVNFALVASVGANITSYSNTGLAVDTTYYYRVKAYNSGGSSPYSNVASATTGQPAPVAPAAPSNLTAAALSDTEIRLNWTQNSSNESGFFVERSLNGSSGWSQVAAVGTNAITYRDSGLNSFTTYYYRVRAHNTAGTSAYSGVVLARTKRN
ncbi:MAG: fibronectin type III domain-containing protein [Verrucomicrobiales bacterium]|nr:fibronectin type III domain-containing protein [Verrucomicrobiales bacterium]